MSHLDSSIPSSINYASLGPEILRFSRITFDFDTFVTLSSGVLKIMQKLGNKHRSTISMLKKICCKYFNVFKVFADRTYNFMKLFSSVGLGLYIKNFVRIIICSLFLCLFVSLILEYQHTYDYLKIVFNFQ